MDRPACSRLWQVEAIADGRLGGSELASFERHTKSCRLCSQEVQRLRELDRLLADLPVLEVTPLERRRQRQDLLRRANQLAVESPPHVSRRALGVAVALAATTAMAASGTYVLRASTPVPARVVALAQQVVGSSAHMGARVQLHTATLAPSPAPAQPVAVAVPAPVAERRAPAQHRARRHARRGTHSVAGHAPVQRASAQARELAARAPGSPATSKPTAGQDFAVAMGAFNAGNFGRADHLFAAFVQHHPADSRAEDASFLRAVARQRRGDIAGAKVLARQYLQSYPGALRHEEAEAMLDR